MNPRTMVKGPSVADQPTGIDEVTWIAGRPLEAFTSRGETATIEIACERVGPPVDVGARKGTSFRVTLRNVPVLADTADTADTGADATGLATIERGAEGMLQDAPPETVATVAAQERAYEQWLATRDPAPDPGRGRTAGASS